LSLSDALAERDVSRLPSKRDEDWRWTDLRGLIRVLPEASPVHAAPVAPGPFEGLGDVEALFVNGRLQSGVEWMTLPAGQARALRLRFVSATAGTSHAAAARLTVGAGANLTLLETYEGLAGEYLADADLEIVLEAGASLERIILTADAADAVSVSTARVTLAPGARFSQCSLSDGAKRQRIETRVSHPGAGAAVRIDGVYLLSERRHADGTTAVIHGGVDGSTAQLIKGVVTDQARGVFQGRIVVEPGADRTDARMGHHALILSDRAEVDAKPELLIFADDVSCAHGNTIGALDDQALFYAQQRGIPEDEARAMLTEAFIGEVIDRIEFEPARERARAWAADRLRSGA
jgi:Fe-S cluster assembly protein SufD